jgi:CheY-like chemotaxis protein
VYKAPARVADAVAPPVVDPGLIPVLAVDDRAEDLLIYERLLRDSPFQLIPVTNLRDARRAIHTVRPRAVLLDVLLGTEDTWSFLAQLKSDAATAGIPVLMVTSVQDQAKAFALGAEAYGVKPLARDWLLGELTRLTRPRTALVIDDDEGARYAIGQMIRQAGWETIEARDGLEGLRRMAESAVGAVFLDVLMPGMNGLDVLRAMRESPASRTLPVFVSTSASLDAADKALIERLGARELPKSALAPERVAAVLAGV